MTLTKRIRYEVLKRDNHTCRYCGATAPDAKLQVDHVTPTALGGTDEPSNLVAACRDCNYGKASTSPAAATVDDVTQSAVRWAAAMKLAAERVGRKEDALLEYVQAFEIDAHDYMEAIDLPPDWRESIAGFYKAGLPIDQLTRALAISVSKSHVSSWDRFRYMCGICWKVLTEIQETAKAILEEEHA